MVTHDRNRWMREESDHSVMDRVGGREVIIVDRGALDRETIEEIGAAGYMVNEL